MHTLGGAAQGGGHGGSSSSRRGSVRSSGMFRRAVAGGAPQPAKGGAMGQGAAAQQQDVRCSRSHAHMALRAPAPPHCSGPREDATRIGSAGVVRRQAVDVSPLRRVNQAIWLITTGARESAFRNIKTIAECLADELINAAKGSSNRCARAAGGARQPRMRALGAAAACALRGSAFGQCARGRWPAPRLLTRLTRPHLRTAPPAATPSRRRTRLSAWPRPTAK